MRRDLAEDPNAPLGVSGGYATTNGLVNHFISQHLHVGRLRLHFQKVLYMFIPGTYTGAWLRRENAAYIPSIDHNTVVSQIIYVQCMSDGDVHRRHIIVSSARQQQHTAMKLHRMARNGVAIRTKILPHFPSVSSRKIDQ